MSGLRNGHKRFFRIGSHITDFLRMNFRPGAFPTEALQGPVTMKRQPRAARVPNSANLVCRNNRCYALPLARWSDTATIVANLAPRDHPRAFVGLCEESSLNLRFPLSRRSDGWSSKVSGFAPTS